MHAWHLNKIIWPKNHILTSKFCFPLQNRKLGFQGHHPVLPFSLLSCACFVYFVEGLIEDSLSLMMAGQGFKYLAKINLLH